MVRVQKHPSIPGLSLIDTGDAVPGMEGFICSYVLQRGKTAIVDVGPSSCIPGLLEGLALLDICPADVDYILTSHIHLDHGGGLAAALGFMPGAKAFVHPNGIRHTERPVKLWEASLRTLGNVAEMYGRPGPVPSDRLVPAEDGIAISLGNTALTVLFTLGHAPHHMSFLDQDGGLLFAGEVCGVRARGVRRPALPPPLYLDQELDSLDRLIALRPSVICYGHYGWEASAGARLRAHRRQLLMWRDIVAEGLDQKYGPEQIAQEIVRRGELSSSFDRLTPLQREREMFFVLNAVVGLIGHLERRPLHVLGQDS
ncbi:MAG: MBL fold metallo-hydrolase [Chloroflexi bacterium]|nr:MBL fold metallo-hydrolase [Chloroflexota bacterium]